MKRNLEKNQRTNKKNSKFSDVILNKQLKHFHQKKTYVKLK